MPHQMTCHRCGAKYPDSTGLCVDCVNAKYNHIYNLIHDKASILRMAGYGGVSHQEAFNQCIQDFENKTKGLTHESQEQKRIRNQGT